MRWRLVQTYIDDLSYKYVHVRRIFLDKYYGYALHSTNEAYCTREVVRKFPLAIQRLYTMNSTTHSDTIEIVRKFLKSNLVFLIYFCFLVRTIFDALKNGLNKYINEQATWMSDETTKTIAKQKINALTASIGYTSIASDDVQLDDYYERVCIYSMTVRNKIKKQI